MFSAAVKVLIVSAVIAVPAVFLAGKASYFSKETALVPFSCEADGYSTEIVSLDPLVIYIKNFVSLPETELLVASGENSFQSSQVYLHGRKQKSTERTSQTAGLPRDELVVQCVTARARRFLGTAFTEGKDDIGILQLVKYKAGQRFDLHHDWYDRPQVMNGRRFNRIASFFAFLHANCTDGETHFPYLKPLQDVKSKDAIDHEGKFRLHEKGGVAFKPIRGNALFWMNLAANGTGDKRVMHAGLPVTDGTKIAMNIWPRKFYD